MIGDRLGDGETAVSGLYVPLILILYCIAKAIAGLLVTRKLGYFIVTLRICDCQISQDLVLSASLGIVRLFVGQIPKNELEIIPELIRIEVDRVGLLFEPTTSAHSKKATLTAI